MDALALRDSLPRLNEVFTDPAVPKIFAGEESQLRALQRDASVFTVNLFSLQQAARVLAIPQTDICALLKRFAGVEVKLLTETADWRVRPLAGKWREDACAMTHFMPFLYDSLRNALLENSPRGLNLVVMMIKDDGTDPRRACPRE